MAAARTGRRGDPGVHRDTGVITPHILDGRLLADGGILDPLPMAPIAAVNADLTIAVSLSGSEAGGRYEPTAERATTEWWNRMWRSTSSLFESSTMLNRFGLAQDDAVDADEPEEAPAEATTSSSTARKRLRRPRWAASR